MEYLRLLLYKRTVGVVLDHSHVLFQLRNDYFLFLKSLFTVIYGSELEGGLQITR